MVFAFKFQLLSSANSSIKKIREFESYCVIYKGLHEAIITDEQFKQAQAIFTSKDKKRIYVKESNTPYLLKGIMKCECCDSSLTPTYTKKSKNNTIYRYYKPNKAMKQGEHTNCKIGNVPAEQIENLALEQVYSILKSPEIVTQTMEQIKDSKIKDELPIEEQEIINSLKNIEAVWDELFPREKKIIINSIIKEIVIAHDNVKIVFNEIGLLNLVCEGSKNEQAKLVAKNAQGLTQINIPIGFRKRGGKSFITTPDGKELKIINAKTITKRIDTALVKALIKANEWKQEMQKNENISIRGIARREGKTSSYISRIYKLNFLAPDIKKAILTNNAPAGLTLEEIMGNRSIDWDEQRKAFGMHA